MQSISSDIFGVIASFLDHDHDYFSFISTCKQFQKLSKKRPLKNEYDVSVILKLNHKYIFSNMFYNFNTYETRRLRRDFVCLQNIIPSTLTEISFGDKFHETIDQFFFLPKLRKINLGIFYHNEDALQNIPEYLNKDDIITTIISNIICLKKYSGDIKKLYKIDNRSFPSIFRERSTNSSILWRIDNITLNLQKENFDCIYDINKFITTDVNEWSGQNSDIAIIFRKIDIYRKYDNILKEDKIGKENIDSDLLLDFLNVMYQIIIKRNLFLEKLYQKICVNHGVKTLDEYISWLDK